MTKQVQTIQQDDLDKELNSLPTKSSKIRFLLSKGLTRSAVAKKLNIRYQHVRNVEITPIKKEKK